VVDQIRSDLGHTPGITGGTDTASLTGKSDQKVVTTFRTPGACEPIGQYAAFQIAAKLPLDIGRYGIILPTLTRQAQVGL
jgi:hypothetical protein